MQETAMIKLRCDIFQKISEAVAGQRKVGMV
jgi:hypothetical protein